ncbi:MAG: hypothetical protein WBA18_05205 [Terracidiphilus sp.]
MPKFDVNGKTGFSGGENEVQFVASEAMQQRPQKFYGLIRNPERFLAPASASIFAERHAKAGRF